MSARIGRRSIVALGVAVVVTLGLIAWFGLSRVDGTRRGEEVAPPGAPATGGSTSLPVDVTVGTNGGTVASPSTPPVVPGTASPVAGPAAVPPTRGAPGAATALASATQCQYLPSNTSEPGESLTWTLGAPPGDAQRLELSSDPQGFKNGRVTSRPIPARDAGYSWMNITVGQTYTWRVVTTIGSRSSTSATQTFTAQPCQGAYDGP